MSKQSACINCDWNSGTVDYTSEGERINCEWHQESVPLDLLDYCPYKITNKRHDNESKAVYISRMKSEVQSVEQFILARKVVQRASIALIISFAALLVSLLQYIAKLMK